MAKKWNPCPLCGGAPTSMSGGPAPAAGLRMRINMAFGCKSCNLWLTGVVEYDYRDRAVEPDVLLSENLKNMTDQWNRLDRRRDDGQA